jgi:hypothetical protein
MNAVAQVKICSSNVDHFAGGFDNSSPTRRFSDGLA